MRDNKKTLSTKITYGTYSMAEDLADKTDLTTSHILRTALKKYIAEHHDNLQKYPDSMIKTIKDMDKYREAEAEAHYRKHENKVIREQLNAETFEEFMDRYLNQMCYGKEQFMTEEELNEYLRDNMSVLRDRARHHDKVQEYKNRYENPKSYVDLYRENKNLLED